MGPSGDNCHTEDATKSLADSKSILTFLDNDNERPQSWQKLPEIGSVTGSAIRNFKKSAAEVEMGIKMV